jgi:6-phosphogluconolactonase
MGGSGSVWGRPLPQPELVPELLPFPDPPALSRAAAELVAEIAEAAVAARGRFTMALSGGRTPEMLYGLLASEYRDRMPWSATHLYFGDERCVPPTDPDSNYRMANATLLSQVPGLEQRTHRIEGERGAVEAASRYEAVLRDAFRDEATTFDLVLLGMGPDGHTASLFPGSPALEERERWAVPTEAPPTMKTRARVTLTYPVLTASRIVLFLCAGADKRERLAAVLADTNRPDSPYPASRVTAQERLVWLVDDAAMP